MATEHLLKYTVIAHREAGSLLTRVEVEAYCAFDAAHKLGSMFGMPWAKWHDITVHDPNGNVVWNHDPNRKVAIKPPPVNLVGNPPPQRHLSLVPKAAGPAERPKPAVFVPTKPVPPPAPIPSIFDNRIIMRLETGEIIRES
jgi:hypothetical protein